MFERGRVGPFQREQAQPMVTAGRAALASIQERGQILELDLQEVPRQDSGRSAHALEHDPTQRRVDSLTQVDRPMLEKSNTSQNLPPELYTKSRRSS
jgi:hypothetical protein